MRTVSVENYKLPGNSFAQFFCYQFQQFVIRGVVIGIPHIFFNEIIRVGFFAEEVYKWVVIALVREKGGLVTGFLECCDNPFLIIDGIKTGSTDRWQQHRNTLVGSVWFCQHMAESCQSANARQSRVSLPFVAVQSPVACPWGFSHHHYIYFPFISLMSTSSMKGKIFRGLVIIPRLGRPLKSKCYVVAYVGRIQFGFRLIPVICQISSA